MRFRPFRFHTSSTRALAPVALAATAGILVAGCGEVSNTITPKPGTANQITVELSGPPSAYDVGLYAAQGGGYFKQADIDVTFLTPSTGQDPLTLLQDRQVEVAISSEPSVFLARQLGLPVVSVAALVQRPLSQIAVPVVPVHPPSGGASIGSKTPTTTTTAPTTTTTTAVGTTTSGAGSSTTTTSTQTTTTPTPAQVPTGSVWPAQLQTLLSSSSAPTYNGVVTVVRKGTIIDHPSLIRRFVQAAARGYKAVRSDPRMAVKEMIAADPSLAPQRRQLLATVRAMLPSFFPTGLIWGYQNATQWNAFGSWMSRHGLISNPNAITDASTNELLAGEGV